MRNELKSQSEKQDGINFPSQLIKFDKNEIVDQFLFFSNKEKQSRRKWYEILHVNQKKKPVLWPLFTRN